VFNKDVKVPLHKAELVGTFSSNKVASPIFNDNESCIKWPHSMTTKQICHMEMHKNAVCKSVQKDLLKVVHVSGHLNLAEIFTKEMRNGAHF
jgi:hypothetical protein